MQPFLKTFNRLVRAILTSRFHGLMSSNTMLLQFKGRRSDRSLQTPVSYHIQNGEVHCFTMKKFIWWKNLLAGDSVFVTVKGGRQEGVPTITIDDPSTMLPALTDFFSAVPRDRRGAGIGLDQEGRPQESDVAKVIPDMVYINIRLVT